MKVQAFIKFSMKILLGAVCLFIVSCAPSDVIEAQNRASNNASGYPGPEVRPTVATPDQCHSEKGSRISVSLKDGWSINPAPNVTTIYNYPDDLPMDHGRIEVPEGSMKVEIYVNERDKGQSIQDYYKDNQTGVNVDEPLPEFEDYGIGEYKGQSFSHSVTGDLGEGILVVMLEASETELLTFNIHPANPKRLKEALHILSSVRIKDVSEIEKACALSNSKEDISKPKSINSFQQTKVVDPFLCPHGTYTGNEAHSSTIPLQMPFLSGEKWIVGGGGSFYGNHRHCSHFNNYYATDWNLADGSNETGRSTLVVAAGEVTSILTTASNCFTTNQLYERYGCYVEIKHANGYQTLYAHLSSVEVSVGDVVVTGQKLGEIGGTGPGTIPVHLHMNFRRQLTNQPYSYFSRCYNNNQTCPNGEAPASPQGYRPSPMQAIFTDSSGNSVPGNYYLQDGLAFTSMNGLKAYMPITLKD